MSPVLDTLLVIVVILNVAALGTSRIRAAIRLVALQGVLLGVMPLLAHDDVGAMTVVVAVVAMLLKGGIIPAMLLRAMRDARIRREVEPLISLSVSMLLGGVGVGISLELSRHLPLAGGSGAHLVVAAALATVFTGFILLTTRRKAVMQVLGYLVVDNGIFIFGLLLLEAMPLLVEAGVLLDLVVAIFVMGIIISHIQREFSSLDTQELSALKEE